MDKLELDLNDLEVDSFQTSLKQEDEQGTVYGNETQDPEICKSKIYTCYDTCDATCGDTCDLTCGVTCRPVCGPSGDLGC